MRRAIDTRSPFGWILVAGFALTSLGLAAEPQDGPPPGFEPPPDPTPGQSSSIPYTPGYGTADSNGSMIAVTGVDVTGGSLLYLIDTETRHLSIYQATGGTKSTMNLKWVGARNIDLDLQVDGWNDESEYTYKKLSEAFDPGGGSPAK
ncbi:MAG TPA: hypothetical protein ENJ09_04500 [Planctomycetes bacterium]|nr:hypothetical protein [Planctomycetota bacterium]